MNHASDEIRNYIAHIQFPVSKEELVNGLLAREGPAHLISILDRLPRDRYEDPQQVLADANELATVHPREVGQARTYDDFRSVVLRHVGDVQHTTKQDYTRVVTEVLAAAQQQGTVDHATAREFELRLDAEFVQLRRAMSEVYDDAAPVDPRRDMPHTRRDSCANL